MKIWSRRIAKNLKNSALSVQGRIFRSYFGQWDDSIFSFWNFLTFSRIRKSPVWIWKLFIKPINFVWTFGTRNTFKSFWWSSDWLIGSSLNFDDTYLPMQKFGGQQQKKFQVEIHSLSIRQKFCSSFPFRNTSKLLPVWKLLIEWMYHMLKLKYLHLIKARFSNM